MAQGKRNRKVLKSHEIKNWLEEILGEFNRRDFLSTDPLSIVHSYDDPKDQELIAFVTSLFSYGNVASIIAAVKKILSPLGSKPKDRLLNFTTPEIRRLWKNAYYRFYSDDDIVYLITRTRDLIEEHESLQNLFLSASREDHLESLSQFRESFTRDSPKTPGLKFMFADPKIGTAKRSHMFLRWVVRKDEVDLGLWERVSKASLIQPLDTHLFQIGQKLKLTERKTPGLEAALQMTKRFREWNPEDPIKYDFALCRLGVLREKEKRLELLQSRPLPAGQSFDISIRK